VSWANDFLCCNFLSCRQPWDARKILFLRRELTIAVAALSTAGLSQYVSASSNVAASQQAFQSLQQSLASGNLSDAQTAFNTYQKLNQSSAGTGSASSTSQFSSDLTALGSAIGSGNLSTAQQAFATLQSDLQTAPSQAVTNAESAAAQTVQWVDDLLNLSSSDENDATQVDPTTAILDSVYRQNQSTNATDPTISILESAYGANGGSSASTADSASSAATPAANGNGGSGASVNVYV
jgi:hypothetical protein